MTSTHPHPGTHSARHAASFAAELSVAQRAAVNSDARLVVVQGGPGTGKTEAALARIVRLAIGLRQDSAPLLALVTSDAKVQAFRERLARALAAAGCAETAIARMTSRVVAATTPAADAVTGDADASWPAGTWPPEAMRRVSAEAAQLAPVMGLARHPDEATALLVGAMRLVASGRGPHEGAGSEGDWLRRGVALVEESVRFAQVETLRHLRALEGAPGWIGDLGRQLRRATDVGQRSRDLRSAVDRALRVTASDRADLERLRGWVDIAAIDLAEAARREAVAAIARARLWDTAQVLARDLGVPAHGVGASARGGPENSLIGGARHVIVDDAQDLSSEVMGRVRRLLAQASVFVTGDPRAAAWRAGSDAPFPSLLREAGQAVVLLEAPRFGAGIGRFINALGCRLWPASEPGGYAPAIVRIDSDPSAAAPVELWLVRRRAEARPDGGDHPEPIADARRREAMALAAGVRRMHGGGRDGGAAVLVQSDGARGPVSAALEAEGVGAFVDVCTVDECQGLEWSTVFVAGLDEAVGGPSPRRTWIDPKSGLAVVWPEDDSGRRVWPFSSLLLAQRAAGTRDAQARRRLFLAAARARTRLVLAGVTRDRAAGGESCVAPVEWLRRQLGVTDLAVAPLKCRMGEASVGVRVVEAEEFPTA